MSYSILDSHHDLVPWCVVPLKALSRPDFKRSLRAKSYTGRFFNKLRNEKFLPLTSFDFHSATKIWFPLAKRAQVSTALEWVSLHLADNKYIEEQNGPNCALGPRPAGAKNRRNNFCPVRINIEKTICRLINRKDFVSFGKILYLSSLDFIVPTSEFDSEKVSENEKYLLLNVVFSLSSFRKNEHKLQRKELHKRKNCKELHNFFLVLLQMISQPKIISPTFRSSSRPRAKRTVWTILLLNIFCCLLDVAKIILKR